MSNLTSTSHNNPNKILPAHLDFLAIYNPSLGATEETERDQVVYYYSGSAREQKHGQKARDEQQARAEQDEQLRQVGLAQGIVNFARSFSNDEAVDSVETEKHRIVLKELENGWWILAAIHLTRLPRSTTSISNVEDPKSEYSSREVSPPALLLQELVRAHDIFRLHHSPSLNELFLRVSRDKFCNLLEGFWTPFASGWHVLLHGNPAVDIYGGIKLAAGGELGVGVGEEEWGSGEREVFEGLVASTEGLVDLTVARFGELDEHTTVPAGDAAPPQIPDYPEDGSWIGKSEHPGSNDGLVFAGVGAISHTSLNALCAWTETIYVHGENAYGVASNPSSGRRRPRRKRRDEDELSVHSAEDPKTETADNAGADGFDITQNLHDVDQKKPQSEVPLTVITDAEQSLETATQKVDANPVSNQDPTAVSALTDPEVWVKYLTLGYGSSWFNKKPLPEQAQVSDESAKAFSKTTASQNEAIRIVQPEQARSRSLRKESTGRFLIGLKGNLDEDSPDGADDGERLSLRTIHVELTGVVSKDNDDDCSIGSQDSDGTLDARLPTGRSTEHKRLRVVVYMRRPFIFTLLFEPDVESLSMPTFFIDLHHHLNPLHKPLLASTSPSKAASRLQGVLDQQGLRKLEHSATQPIFDLIYDPSNLMIHSSIPNIPLPGTFAAEGINLTSNSDPSARPWTRVEALNVHSQILNTYAETRRSAGDRERTGKTGRGWWIVWMRLPATTKAGLRGGIATGAEEDRDGPAPPSTSYGINLREQSREAFLVRRAGDKVATRGGIGSMIGRESGAAFGRLTGRDTSSSAGQAGSGWGPVKLAEGIGVDARRYVEGLLSLNR